MGNYPKKLFKLLKLVLYGYQNVLYIKEGRLYFWPDFVDLSNTQKLKTGDKIRNGLIYSQLIFGSGIWS